MFNKIKEQEKEIADLLWEREHLFDTVRLMEQAIKELALESELTCEYCKHNLKCGEECEFYEEGRGMYDENGKFLDWKWTCMDFDFGTCRKLEDTPCNQCFGEDGEFHFEWNGKLRGDSK